MTITPRLFLIVISYVLGVACGSASSVALAQTAEEVVQLSLLADRAAVAPGSTVTLGVAMKIKPGWRTYWLNAGDAGAPTKVEWKPADGFTAGPVLWPIPLRFTQSIDHTSYGYEGEVMLLTEVKAPADAKPGTTTVLSASVSYLVSDGSTSLAGNGEVRIGLSIKPLAEPANMALFAGWRNRVPVEPAQAPIVGMYQTPPQRGTDKGFIDVRWKGPVTDVEFFPATSRRVAVSLITVDHRGDVSRIGYAQKVYDPDDLDTPQRGLIVYRDPGGNQQALWAPMKLRGPGKKN